VPDRCHPVWRAPRAGHRLRAHASRSAPLQSPPRARHASTHAVPGQGHEPSRHAVSELERVHDDLFRRTRARPGMHWWFALALCGTFTVVLFSLIAYTIATGIGVWGNNIPAAWAFGIINFVFWIGIGHAGTFISAILYLLEQGSWRNPISRLTETMTIFAVVQAGMFPVLHLGRPWFAYWLAPYPDVMGVWPQVKSALPWDMAAVTTYLTVSLLFWYVGMIPDLASLRDHHPSRGARKVYGLLAIGWRGDSR